MNQQPFTAWLIERELRVPVDVESGEVLALGGPASLGVNGRAVKWVPASGRATLYSFTVYHKTYSSEFKVPYNVAFVELEEGLRLISTVITADLSTLRIGMPLTASFELSGRLVFIPS